MNRRIIHRVGLVAWLCGALAIACASPADAQKSLGAALGGGAKITKAQALLYKAVLVDLSLHPSQAARRSLPSLLQAATLFYEAGAPVHEYYTLVQIGGAYRVLDRPDSALMAYTRARATIGKAPAKYVQALAVIPNLREFIVADMDQAVAEATINHYTGDIYRYLGNPDSALIYYRQGEFFIRDLFDQSRVPSEAESKRTADGRTGPDATFASIATLFLEIGRPDSALVYFRRARESAQCDCSATRIYTRGAGSLTEAERRYLTGTGAAFRDAGQPDSSLAYFRMALRVARSGEPLWYTHQAKYEALDGIASAYTLLGQTDSAATHYHGALALARKIQYRSGEARTLLGLARLYHRRIQPNGIALATAHYDSAAAVLAGLTDFTGGDANRLTFAENRAGLGQDWVLAWLAREPHLGRKSVTAAALAVVERGRAQALLELVRTSSVEVGGATGADTSRTKAGSDLVAEGQDFGRAFSAGGAAAISYLVTADTVRGPGEEIARPLRPAHDAAVAEPRPTLVWSRAPGATGYVIQLFENGRRLRRVVTGTDTTWTLPGTASALARGKGYSWSVSALPDGDEVTQHFRIAGDAEIAAACRGLEEIRAAGLDPAGDGLFLTAITYRDAGLFYNVISALERLWARGEARGPMVDRLAVEALQATGASAAAREFGSGQGAPILHECTIPAF